MTRYCGGRRSGILPPRRQVVGQSSAGGKRVHQRLFMAAIGDVAGTPEPDRRGRLGPPRQSGERLRRRGRLSARPGAASAADAPGALVAQRYRGLGLESPRLGRFASRHLRPLNSGLRRIALIPACRHLQDPKARHVPCLRACLHALMQQQLREVDLGHVGKSPRNGRAGPNAGSH
jgi:hypothetical protein